MSPSGEIGVAPNAGSKSLKSGNAAIGGAHVDLGVLQLPFGRARQRRFALQVLGGAAEGLQQVVQAGGDADGEDQQHAVDRGLVDLDLLVLGWVCCVGCLAGQGRRSGRTVAAADASGSAVSTRSLRTAARASA